MYYVYGVVCESVYDNKISCPIEIYFLYLPWIFRYCQSSWSKGISEMKSKQQSPCSNCMHQPVTSWHNACSMGMHWPVTSQADACTYCMESKDSSLNQTYLYSGYFGVLLFVEKSSKESRQVRS